MEIIKWISSNLSFYLSLQDLSFLWGWGIDKVNPDRFDIIGASIALVGVFNIMYGRELIKFLYPVIQLLV